MEKKNDRYENKAIRFYDKDDHYELWFMDDFYTPTSGKFEGGQEYTLICDIMEELHNGDASKELHIFIWSFGGSVDTFVTLLQLISRYRRRVAINMGCADSCGWLLFFSCEERYASHYSEFVFHEPSLFTFGKVEESAARIQYSRHRLEIILRNSDIYEYLTPDERKLAKTSEVFLTGEEIINRGGCQHYSLYHKRIAPKAIKGEFYIYNDKIFRYHNNQMCEYVPTNEVHQDKELLMHSVDGTIPDSCIRGNPEIIRLLDVFKNVVNPDMTVSLDSLTDSDARKLKKLLGLNKD